jgi:glycosyltransferase involved in cell wall biosynthesis
VTVLAAVALVIVTPVFEDRDASTRLFRELRKTLGPDVFIVAVDDGSIRQPVDPVSIAVAGLRGHVVRLCRNVGHQRAIAVGIDYVAEHMPQAVCVVMDSDGEDLPETIPLLFEALASDEVDVVVAERKSRVETWKFKLFYAVYKVLFRLMTGRGISFGNFMALKPLAVQRLSAMHELGVHVAGSVLVSRLRVVRRPIDRGPRYAGNSKMNFSGLVLHGLQAFMVFAEFVLVRVAITCAGVAALAILGIVASVLLKLVGLATPGWFSTALGILLLVLSQTGVLTLMSLMLTGIVKGNHVLLNDYLKLVDKVLPADA